MSSELYDFIGEDSRQPIHRLRRFQLHRIADSMGLQYPPGATKDVMIKLFEMHDIDVTQTALVQWQIFTGKDVDGNMRQEAYPVIEPSNSARNGVNAAAVLTERMSAKEQEEQKFQDARLGVLERENAELKKTNEQLQGILETRLAALEDNRETDPPTEEDTPVKRFWGLFRKARDLGLAVRRDMKEPQIQALIDKHEREQQNG